MFVLRFVQYAHLLPTPAIPYKRDGKAIVLLYSDKTNQLLRKRNLSFANIVFAAVFWGKRPEIFEKQQVFQTCFSKKCRKKNAYVSTFCRHILFLRRYLANYCLQTGLQLNSTINQIIYQVEFVCFLKKYKNKSRINRCGLILLYKLIYLFLKTASFIILANSS